MVKNVINNTRSFSVLIPYFKYSKSFGLNLTVLRLPKRMQTKDVEHVPASQHNFQWKFKMMLIKETNQIDCIYNGNASSRTWKGFLFKGNQLFPFVLNVGLCLSILLEIVCHLPQLVFPSDQDVEIVLIITLLILWTTDTVTLLIKT